uniref:Uncharacterized protein n=1 Tax=Cyprinus carpio carpio TaxID=630221 RepID=A0A9J8AU23_CYPCA
ILTRGVGWMDWTCHVLNYCFCHVATSGPRVCIVGGGPASFYTAQQLLKVCMPHHIHTFSGNISSSIRFFYADCI